MYHPLGSARARNPGVTTEVVGSISRRKRGEEAQVPNFSAICTLDGEPCTNVAADNGTKACFTVEK